MKSVVAVVFTVGVLLLVALSRDTALAMQRAAATGDAARGKQVFEKRCTGCHTIAADREGPRLAGVFGRKAGSVVGYAYSAGLKKSGTNGLVWDDASLEKWLSDPDALVPDNNMEFRVPKTQERLDLIAYLKHAK